MSIIIGRYTDHMKFYCFFHILLVLLCIIVYIVVCFVCFKLILYIVQSYCYVYVFLLLCLFRSRYCVSLCRSVYCLCVSVYCTIASGCQPNCSYQIHHIISYINFSVQEKGLFILRKMARSNFKYFKIMLSLPKPFREH